MVPPLARGAGTSSQSKDFEALLALALLDYQTAPYLVIEGEGKNRYRQAADFLYQAMQKGQHLCYKQIYLCG